MEKNVYTAMQNHLLSWIGSDDGYSLLLSLAARLVKDVQRSGPIAAIWPYPAISSDDRYHVDEIAHDFFVFLAETLIPQLSKNPELVYLVESNNIRKFFEYAQRKFLWTWHEKSRNKEHNPAGYLYRRLRETISMSGRFKSDKGTGNVFLFQLKPADPSKLFSQTHLGDESFASWAVFPESGEITSEKEIFKEGYLHRAALFFWQEACSKTTVQALAVRDLQRYLLSIHPWLFNASAVELEDDCHIAIDSEMDLDIRAQVESISLQAEHLIAGWTRQQCAVFVMRLKDPPVKLKEIAELLGLSDHNAVHRIFSTCKNALIGFSSNWPGPSLAELPEECAELFLIQVKKCAKNRIAVHNER